ARILHLFPCYSVIVSPPATIYTLSLHDALPILPSYSSLGGTEAPSSPPGLTALGLPMKTPTEHQVALGVQREFKGQVLNVAYVRSEEHTSELQSPYDVVCRLLLEKKKQTDHDIL